MSRGNGLPFLSFFDIRKNEMTPREVSWEEIENHSRTLADKIIKNNLKYDVILGIGRGGLVPAVILSHQVGIPLVPVNWQTRDGKYDVENYSILNRVTEFNTRILIVDDINDTGKTLREIVEATNEVIRKASRSCEVDCVTIYQKPSTTFINNVYVEEVEDNDWIVFPWERE